MMRNRLFIISGLSGLLVILFGAMGAHAVAEVVSTDQLSAYKTGVMYQLFHTLAIMLIGVLMKEYNGKLLVYAAHLFLFGIVCFSFSLYLLALKDVFGWASFSKILGPITPLGGLLFMGGWVAFIIHFVKAKMNEQN